METTNQIQVFEVVQAEGNLNLDAWFLFVVLPVIALVVLACLFVKRSRSKGHSQGLSDKANNK
jgi:hypothetical protein